jgi:hypothetical protein
MEEEIRVKVVYEDSEFELTEEELDRVIALASKRLRSDIISSRLGLGMFPVKNFVTNEQIKVMKQGYESSFYDAMREALLYAIETDMLENYRISKADINHTLHPETTQQEAVLANTNKFIELNQSKKLQHPFTALSKQPLHRTFIIEQLLINE